MAKYTAKKLEDKLNDNHWLVTKTNDDGTIETENVYLSAKGNTLKRAIAIFKEAKISETREI